MVDLRQLQQFVMVATELNFHRAAERLFMSQPPLSAAIRRLEQDINVVLFDRNRHQVRLTSAGEVFLKEARRTLAQAQFAVEAAQGIGQGLAGVLRLSFVPSAALDLLPPLLQRFQKMYPGIRLVLTAETTEREITALRSGSIDLAIVVPPVEESFGVDLAVLRVETMVLAVPVSHRFAAKKQVPLRSLAKEWFISFPFTEGRGFAGSVLAACHSAGFSPRIAQEATQMQTILTLVASGLGVALVPAAMQSVHIHNVTYLDVSGSQGLLRYELALASMIDRRSPIVKAFITEATRSTPKSLQKDKALCSAPS
ncbi:LysR family transcriptional regulator [Paralcaligenes ginsengisoli]